MTVKFALILLVLALLSLGGGCDSENNRKAEEPETGNEAERSQEIQTVAEGESVELFTKSRVRFKGAESLDISVKKLEDTLKSEWEHIGGPELNNPYSEEAPDLEGPQPSLEGKLISGPVHSPQGNYLAFILTYPGDIMTYSVLGLLDPDNGEIRFSNAVDDHVETVTWSPDGSLIAYQTVDLVPSTTAIYVDEAQGHNVLTLDKTNLEVPPDMLIENLKWTEKGHRLNLTGRKQEGETWEHFLDLESEELTDPGSENFVKQTAEYDLDQDLPGEIEKLMVEGREEEIEGGALDLEAVLKKDKEERGPPLKAVTHLMAEDDLIELEDMITMHQLKEGAPELAEPLNETNIYWYYGGEQLYSTAEVYETLEEDWNRVLSSSLPEMEELEELESILGNPPEEPYPRYFDGIGAMEASPSGEKIAFDLDFMSACAFRMGAFGIIDLNENEVYFTHIGNGDLAWEKYWSPDGEYVAYITSHKVTRWLHVDSVGDRQNIYTVDPQELDKVLQEEGMTSLGDQFSASYKDITWEDEGPALQFTVQNIKDSETQEVKEEIDCRLDLRHEKLDVAINER